MDRPDARMTRAVYVISVAAELAGVHPQTLRIYERKGLLAPARTTGRSRRYSDRDIALLRRIQDLTNDGVSLAGVQRILAWQHGANRQPAGQDHGHVLTAVNGDIDFIPEQRVFDFLDEEPLPAGLRESRVLELIA